MSIGIRKYKDIHKGESCYIFGDGPSIKWFDLAKFNDKPGIACGVIPFHNNFRDLDVKYALMIEPWLFCPRWMQKHQYLKELQPMALAYKGFAAENRDIQFFINLSNYIFMRGKNINFIHKSIIQRETDLCRKFGSINPFAGSFHATLTMAYWMGFSKAYLLGFDAWTLHPARTRRWYEKGQGEYLENVNLALDFLTIIREKMDITTIGLGESSSNVESIGYANFTGEEPKFKENYQLMSPTYLDALAHFPGYNIR